MAYDATVAVPTLISHAIAGFGNIWRYDSTDAAAVVDSAGYFTDGGNRGMRVGDIVLVFNSTGNILTTHLVDSVSTTFPGAVDLRDGTTVGSATDTD